MSDPKTFGRIVPTKEEPKRKIATVSVRPPRLAFVIHEEFSFEELTRVIRYNTTVWGGVFNALVPTDGRTLSDGWWATLEAHDPDRIIVCGAIEENLIESVEARLQPLGLYTWEDFFSEEPYRSDRSNNIRILSVLANISDQSGSQSPIGVYIPIIEPKHPLFRYTVAQFGILDDRHSRVYTQYFRAETVDLHTSLDFPAYLNTLSNVLPGWYPLQMTTQGLESTIYAHGVTSPVAIVLACDDYLQDLCAFWAVRMSPTLGRKETLFLPIDVFRSRRNLERLARWCNERLTGANFMVVAAPTVNRRRLRSFRKRLLPLLDDQIKFVDLLVSHFIPGRFRMLYESQREELMWEDDRTHIQRSSPNFHGYLRTTDTWMMDLDVSDPLRQELGYIPPDFPQLNYVLGGEPARHWIKVSGYGVRKAQHALSWRVSMSHTHEFTTVQLPSEEKIFTALLETAEYESELTDKCRYTTGMVELLDQADVLKALTQRHFRRFLGEMANGKAYDLNGILGLTRCPSGGKEEFRDNLNDMALHACLLRGYRLRCPVCNLEKWYPLEQISETISCAGCLSTFQPPLNARFHYRLNRLIEVGMEQGSVPVILTMMLLQKLCERSFLHVPGIKAMRGDVKTDIDILASCDGHLLVAECKQLKSGYGDETAEEIVDQFRREYQAAHEIGAEMIFLSMMTNEEHPTVSQEIEDLNASEGPTVYMLLLDDLERGHLLKTADVSGDGEGSKKATLRDLLPQGSSDKGWIKEPGSRTRSF